MSRSCNTMSSTCSHTFGALRHLQVPCAGPSPFSSAYSRFARCTTTRRTQTAAGMDPKKKAADAEDKVALEKAKLKEQLAAFDNMEVDGNFQAKELEQGKERLKQHLRDLDSLKGELKEAVKAEEKN